MTEDLKLVEPTITDLIDKMVESIATLREYEEYIRKLSMGKIDFCVPDQAIHVYKGIDILAEMLDGKPYLAERHDKYAPWEKRFNYEDTEIFQLSERNGEFA